MSRFKVLTVMLLKTKFFCFIVSWLCILLWFLVNDQLDAQFFSMCLFQFSVCFKQPRAPHQENQLYQYNIWCMSLCVSVRFVCRSEKNFTTCTRNGHQHTVTYTRCCFDSWFSWWWARGCLKHVENWNKHIEKNCASRWSFTKKNSSGLWRCIVGWLDPHF